MKIPNIKKYKTTKDYFEAIYEINKKDKPIFSYRFFAKKLDWPISYLNDVVKGRKKTTIARAIQFSKKFDLNNFQTEYLIFLCLAESENQNISEYFKEKVESGNLKKEKNTPMKGITDLCSHQNYIIFYELIGLSQGAIPLSKLIQAQKSYPEFSDKDFKKNALQFLLKEKLIKKISTDHYRQIENSHMAIDDFDYIASEEGRKKIISANILSLENMIRLYKQFTGRGIFFSSFLNVKKERFPEILERCNSLRDWMISISQEDKSEKLEDHECIKLDLHLAPLFNGIDADVLKKRT